MALGLLTQLHGMVTVARQTFPLFVCNGDLDQTVILHVSATIYFYLIISMNTNQLSTAKLNRNLRTKLGIPLYISTVPLCFF